MINLTPLQEEVMLQWESEAVVYTKDDEVSNEPLHIETWLTDWAKLILDNPRLCLLELGYDDNDWATYVAERNEPENGECLVCGKQICDHEEEVHHRRGEAQNKPTERTT